MIYISFGLKKSGSTLTANLTREVLDKAGHPHVAFTALERGETSHKALIGSQGESTNNIKRWTKDVVDTIEQKVPADRIVMLRTHVAPTHNISTLMRDGRAKGHCAIRDLRDVVLSRMDVTVRQEAAGRLTSLDIRFGDVESTFDALERNLISLYRWLDTANTITLDYERTAFAPSETISTICSQLDLKLDEAEYAPIFAKAAGLRSNKMNVGKSQRHASEMKASDQELVLTRFRQYYDRFYPNANVSVQEPA